MGAGFARPLLPSWHDLLLALSKRTGDVEVEQWLKSDRLSHRDYEGIAQALRGKVDGDLRFEALLKEVLDPDGTDGRRQSDRERVEARLRLLQAIPFHTILTTNFDRLFVGSTPSRETFARVVSSERRPWWASKAWSDDAETRFRSWHAPVVKLHGDLDAEPGERRLAFTTRDYRRLVHEQPGYRAFLRTLFATHTVLYMGFSFTDGYINELRSEILAWIGPERRLDFAIMGNVPPLVCRHLRENEGLECLGFDATADDFSGFDEWLAAIHRATAPEVSLRQCVRGRRILWLDPNPKNNVFGRSALLDEHGAGAAAVAVTKSVDETIAALNGTERWDLIISHFGYDPGGPSNFERFVLGMRQLAQKRQAPVIVFSHPDSIPLNRADALRLGAFDYVGSWPELFAAIERLFANDPGA